MSPKIAAAVSNEPAAPEPTLARHELLPLDKIAESPTNHRQRTWGDMAELTASIKAKGILQPVLVRPMKGIGSNLYELVFGHRRYRAAKSAGLEVIPAMIRELSDVEVLESQVIENCQRENVHPLEEAEGYEQLLAQKDRVYTVDEIAAKVGKSKAYVYGRLKLTSLCAPARKAFYEQAELTASVALLVARIPSPELQEKALEEVLDEGLGDGVMSYRDAQQHIQQKYMLRLADAPFDRADPLLVPSAGVCTTCPKRTGAQPELFGDVKSADLCTDPKCFAEKKDAGWKRAAEEAKAKGVKVLTATEAKKVFEAHAYNSDVGTPVKRDAAYVDLNARCYDDPKQRTYKQLLGKSAPEKVLARDKDGKTRTLVDRAAAAQALKEAGVSLPKPPPKYDATANREKYEREDKIRSEAQRRIAAAVVARFEKTKPDAQVWRLIIDGLADNYDCEAVITRRFPRAAKDNDEIGKPFDFKVVDAAVAKMSEGELRGFALELALAGAIYSGLSDGTPAGKSLLAWAGVDAKALEKEAREALKDLGRPAAKPKAKDSPERPAGGSKPSPKPVPQIPKIAWRIDGTGRVGTVADGTYVLSDRDGEWTARWLPSVGTGKTLFSNGSEAVAADACLAHHVERCTDAMLPPDLVKGDLRGPAVARKKGRR